MTRYRTRPREVEAVQHFDNRPATAGVFRHGYAAFVCRDVDAPLPTTKRPVVRGGTIRVRNGDWILTLPEGVRAVVTNEDFTRDYEECP